MLLEEPLSPVPRTPFAGEKVASVGRQLSLPFYYLIRNLLKSRAGETGRAETANQRVQCWEMLRRELALSLLQMERLKFYMTDRSWKHCPWSGSLVPR